MKIFRLIVITSVVFMLSSCTVKRSSNTMVKKPLKVFILSGQSNMVGMAHINTFEHIKMFPEKKREFKDVFTEEGNPVSLEDVYISSTAAAAGQSEVLGKLATGYGGGRSRECIGPEYAFGVYMHKELKEPFLIIKTAWGGKSLCFDFRPPDIGQWTPPKGHPDLIKKKAPKALAIPKKIDLPVNYKPGEDLVPKYASRVGKFMGLRPMRGVAIGQCNGVYPIYITASPQAVFPGTPFQKGDLIIGINGEGLRKDSIAHWRDAFHGSKNNTWMINVTRWRKGKIESFDFDIAQTLEGGRANIPAYIAKAKKQKEEAAKHESKYYKMMMDHIHLVLSDIKRVYPGYDAEQGYEIAGFAWFQGWNDMVNGGVYPNRDKERGYEQYSWLLKQFINSVRKELKTPEMPFVIGVMGVGGIDEPVTNNKGHFQQAMAEPASYPEFKGTVSAVHTGQYWDKQLEELDTRSWKASLKQNEFRLKDKLEGEALKKAYAEYRATLFTAREEEILRKGKSNKGFHYLGSAKIMVGIGKGFAEAMLELLDK